MSGWSVVGYGDDPIPDDPAVVAAQVDHIRAVAARLAATLAGLPSDGQVEAVRWESSDSGAPEQFKAVVKKLPRDLGLLHARYAKAADALSGFGAALASTKAQAHQNLPVALAAHQDLQAARAGVASMNDYNHQAAQAAAAANAQNPPGHPPVAAQPWSGPDWPALQADAQRRFDTAKANIDQAVTQFHHASATAADQINNAAHDALKNDDSLWGSITHFVLSAAHWVANHVPLGAIAAVLNKISAVAGLLAFIPIPVLQEVAATVAAVTAAGALCCDFVNQLNNAFEGTFSWSDCAITLGLDVVNTVLASVGVASTFRAVAAARTADAAVAATRTAQVGFDAAHADTAAARSLVDGRQAAVDWLTTGSRWKTWPARIFGFTSRAQSSLAAAQDSLAHMASVEDRMAAALRSAKAAQTAATATRISAATTSVRVGVAGSAGSTSGVGWTEKSLSPVQWVTSTGSEVSHLLAWSDNPVGSQAETIGARVVAHHIGVPAR